MATLIWFQQIKDYSWLRACISICRIWHVAKASMSEVLPMINIVVVGEASQIRNIASYVRAQPCALLFIHSCKPVRMDVELV